MSLALFGELGAVTTAKLLAQSQKQLDKLQNKANQTPADVAKIAGLMAQIQVLNGGGTTAQAKAAFRDVQSKAKDAAKPPIIPPMQDIPQDAPTDYTPWIYGGVAVIGGLAAILLLTSMFGKKKSVKEE